MQPVFIHIPPAINPGKGWHARAGTINVYVGEAIDTSVWRVADVAVTKEQVRDYYIHWKEVLDG